MLLSIVYKNSKGFREFDSEDPQTILKQIESLDFSKDFEIVLAKDHCALNLFNSAHERYLYYSTDDMDYEKLRFELNEKSKILGIFKQYILQSDLSKTESFFIEHDKRSKIEAKRKFEQWKINYDERKKKERFDFLKPIAITALIIVIFSGIIYGIYTEEYKFIFQKTDHVNAVIYQTGSSHLGKGVYVQRINFTYTFDNIEYKDSELLFRNETVRKKGDSLLLKISKAHPNRHKIIGFYN